ncbi:sigma-70 family RNA polymerase sigma factor [Pedobacter miscanthi]|uniref:RNA polymerase subunit sigma n=1 Tax=Pedobacter miscanthi TaxID=2259170 RepID=A0A366L3Y3_9SPHI|nr:RNA polymerase sigma factor RpoD/SigA [Pedobacter miscanthi]RBQ07852.1 RNA polymerase subunit sigma [Pedobacter miscanthi]
MRALKLDTAITRRDEDSLNRYLVEVARIELIAPEEETELFLKIRQGDEQALERIVRGNLRFVISCAKKYQRMGLPLNDLVNEGNIGLIKAARLFDPTRGFKFISYAVWWIRQSILAGLAEQVRMIRLPMNQVSNIMKVRAISLKLEQDLEREPTVEELAGLSGIEIDDLAFQFAFDKPLSSLDAPALDGENLTLSGSLPDYSFPETDALLMTESDNFLAKSLLGSLPHRDRKIVMEIYGFGEALPLSMDEISQRNNISHERIRQIWRRAISGLRARSGAVETRLILKRK